MYGNSSDRSAASRSATLPQAHYREPEVELFAGERPSWPDLSGNGDDQR